MRLLRCHIDNFGKLTDFTVDFTENPQVFYEPNGWGKSTLAAFIKVMFYGFAGESKRGATLEKERVRYKPWQGGAYGGEILFEAGGRKYLMNRTFGNKEAEDTFALYDGVTNLKSEDYSTNIGEELFQINQESFLRTVYLAQNACDTGTTDSINAKIGNLADNLDDINNYEKVQQVLKDLRNSLSPTRKTGSLKKQKEAIAELKDELRKAGAIESAVAELEEKLADAAEEKLRLETERKAAQETWETVSRRRAVEAKKTHYESIVSQCLEKQRLVDEGLAVVGGSMPGQEQLTQMQGQYKLLQEKESEASANALQEAEKAVLVRLRERFAEGIPEAAVLSEAQEQISRWEELRLEAAHKALDEGEALEKRRLEEQFGGQDNLAEDGLDALEERLNESLRCISAYMDLKNGLSGKKATLNSLKAMEQQQNMLQQQQAQQKLQQLQEKQENQRKAQMGATVVLVAGVVLAVAGGIVLGLANKAAGIVMLIAGAVAFVLSLGMMGIARKGCETLQEEIRQATEGMDLQWKQSQGAGQEELQSQSSVTALGQEIFEDEKQMARNREFVEAVLRELAARETSEWIADDGQNADWAAIDDSVWEVPLRLRDQLYGWKDDIKRLQRLTAKASDYEAKGYEEQIQHLQEQIARVLKPYCVTVEPGSMRGLLTELSEDRERFATLNDKESKYKVAQAEADRYGQQIDAFLTRYGQETKDLYAGLQRLSACLNEYETLCRELDRLRSEKAEFESAEDFKELEQSASDVPVSEEELRERMNGLDEALSVIGEQIHGYRRQLEDRQAELEELLLQREQLAQAETEYEDGVAYYNRLGYVSEYLERAKESLSAKYIGPVLDSFKRNYALLSGEDGDDFRMDANIHVTKRALGEQREAEAFSAGNRDLINIVLRVALIEAMYQKEKPFLVIDDSFVNLDGKRLETAGEFMRQIARDYQVIYFTCHESRVLMDS